MRQIALDGCHRQAPARSRTAYGLPAKGLLTVALGVCVVAVTGTVSLSAAGASAATTGTLFVANFGGAGASGTGATGSVTSYRVSADGNVAALRTIEAKINAPQGVVFDRSGDLWVANSNTNTLFEYTKSQLAKASPTPLVIISSNSSGSLSGPGGLAFDRSGNLWVANTSVSTVVEYGHRQLAKSGAPTPEVTISNNSFNAPFGLAFDSAGDLWVADNAQQGSPAVYEYAKSELAEAAPAPRLTISMPLSPLGDDTRSGLTFDSAGNLWLVNSAGNSLVEFTKRELSRPAPKPSVTISSSAANDLNAPDDLVFDSAGDAWVANTGGNTVVEFSKGKLAKSGSPAPLRTLSGKATGLNYPMSLAVEP
jgi:sugar lactone lactonase YvrE